MEMIDITSLSVLAVVAGSFGCRLRRIPVKRPPKGAFLYRGFDSAGKLVIRGWLSMNAGGDGFVEGAWCLDRIGAPENIGPQIGLGRLRGRIEGTRLSLNLNPGFMDFNVSLDGAMETASFKGTWRYRTIKEVVSEGAFEAIRKEERIG